VLGVNFVEFFELSQQGSAMTHVLPSNA